LNIFTRITAKLALALLKKNTALSSHNKKGELYDENK